MKIKQIYEVIADITEIDVIEQRKIVCQNVQRLRTERYDEFKRLYGKLGTENTYSPDSFSSYLGFKNVKYYQRLESENDECKYFSADNIYKLSIILDVPVDDLYKDNSKNNFKVK